LQEPKNLYLEEKNMPKKPSSHTAQPAQVHELKITLRGSKPPIWRRVAVPSDIRLSDLHYVIQIVMGWENSHLHQFTFPDNRPKPTREEINELRQTGRWDKLEECMRRDHCISDIRFELEDIEDEKKVKLSELAPAVKSKFVYEYDFGDGWDHNIEVVKIGPPAEGTRYPVCLAGKFACPPEDCGGVWGYYEKLEILKNPKHKDYKDILGWMPPGFNPERLNLEAINAELAELRSGKSRRA
jgi:hypothetical protein